ncbi:hypothetical protein HMI56_005025 [Coelomomyces lativittatus]|nr:hypothetical protein HMI56_005025 [Coelomomyces lativittatus]
MLLISRQGKLRLSKWFITLSTKDKQKIVRQVTSAVLERKSNMCNVLELKDAKCIYRRYASLYFITGLEETENELLCLEIVQRYVEILDQYFGNVCELDLIFNFQKAYYALDELLMAGELQESSKKSVLRVIHQADQFQDTEAEELMDGVGHSRLF